MDMKQLLRNPWNGALLIIGALAVLVGIMALYNVINTPDAKQYAAAQTYANEAKDAMRTVAPASNAYFESFKKELNTSGSAKIAQDKTAKQLDEYVQKESKAKDAIVRLERSKASANASTKQAIMQYASVANQKIDYIGALVRSHADFQAIFGGSNNTVCADIFQTDSETIAERTQSLNEATPNCYKALDALQKSDSVAYSTFAVILKQRIKHLEADMTVIEKSEKSYKELQAKQAEFEARADALNTPDASAQALEALRKEIRETNAKITTGTAQIDQASKSYKQILKEIPELSKDVFSTTASKKIHYFDTLLDIRHKALHTILDDAMNK